MRLYKRGPAQRGPFYIEDRLGIDCESIRINLGSLLNLIRYLI